MSSPESIFLPEVLSIVIGPVVVRVMRHALEGTKKTSLAQSRLLLSNLAGNVDSVPAPGDRKTIWISSWGTPV
ncbi:hypothetical protein [Paraburkholderia hospita]|uniref:hypothetical protein n=1 Tax=Paraburkholderia hospita TaxID=169430 RepID=UPI0002717103|nr:hypothetical protein [Paraburkholderia hospita]EUC14788.1 hypothetical protein PMI06_006614 [Burkholderia sp. BT03]SKC93901.1 hypothetical protein SAMN06266956_5812 [Paraburkholderia hospita]